MWCCYQFFREKIDSKSINMTSYNKNSKFAK